MQYTRLRLSARVGFPWAATSTTTVCSHPRGCCRLPPAAVRCRSLPFARLLPAAAACETARLPPPAIRCHPLRLPPPARLRPPNALSRVLPCRTKRRLPPPGGDRNVSHRLPRHLRPPLPIPSASRQNHAAFKPRYSRVAWSERSVAWPHPAAPETTRARFVLPPRTSVSDDQRGLARLRRPPRRRPRGATRPREGRPPPRPAWRPGRTGNQGIDPPRAAEPASRRGAR